jgi:hypothetical protein
VKPNRDSKMEPLAPSRRALLLESAIALCASSLAVKVLHSAGQSVLALAHGVVDCICYRKKTVPDVRSMGYRYCDQTICPWTPVCIQRGLAAQWMLRRRGIDARLHLRTGRPTIRKRCELTCGWMLAARLS